MRNRIRLFLWAHGVYKWREQIVLAVVWKLPNWLIYWAMIRAASTCIEGDEVVPEVPFMTILSRWGKNP